MSEPGKAAALTIDLDERGRRLLARAAERHVTKRG
jgi:hypothetical protein